MVLKCKKCDSKDIKGKDTRTGEIVNFINIRLPVHEEMLAHYVLWCAKCSSREIISAESGSKLGSVILG